MAAEAAPVRPGLPRQGRLQPPPNVYSVANTSSPFSVVIEIVRLPFAIPTPAGVTLTFTARYLPEPVVTALPAKSTTVPLASFRNNSSETANERVPFSLLKKYGRTLMS
jgi:hypothetical protein